jgi:acetoin utilization deacetylase AcuC-like enzyme
MKAFLDDRQRGHDPRHFMANGAVLPNPEVPGRIDILLAAARAAGARFATPPDAGLGRIAALHTAEYIDFLRRIHARWSRIEGAGPEVIPNIHPASRADGYPASATGQAGWHQADTACPIGAGTWDAAYWSAQSAIAAADAVAGGARAAYALCRPRATMPLPISPAGSVSSTMQALPPNGCGRPGCGPRSSISTCITATAPRACSMPAATF